jgi:serralysin
MTVNLTSAADTLDMYIHSEYDINTVPAKDAGGAFLNLRGQAVDGLAGFDVVTSDKKYGEYFTLTATDAGVLTMVVTGASSTTTFKNVEQFKWVNLTVNLGTAAADTVTGGSLSDKFLFGLGGADTISGLAGADWLMGGAGNDKLIGGAGADRMTGGADKDIFDFNALSEMGKTAATRDVITDFAHGVDKIDLSTINPTNATHKFGTITKGSVFHHTAGELHFTQAGGHTIVAGDVNGDAKIDFQIDLVGTKALTNIDFVL